MNSVLTPGADGRHQIKKGQDMSSEVFKVIEIVGSSPESSDAAIRGALQKASSSIRNMRWFEVIETRGHIENGAVGHFQVTLKVGFTLD